MSPEQLNKHQAFALFNNNNHQNGFKNAVYTGEVIETKFLPNGKSGFVFCNYDYKDQIEQFASKNNSPLNFGRVLCFTATNEIELDTIAQSTQAQQNIEVTATTSKEKYISAVNALKQHIQQGDIYEVNYCITFEAIGAEIDPIAVYARLNAISKAPYSALVKLNDKYIISSSPELFLSKRGNKLITKPIKGTARRSSNVTEDALIKNELQNSLKERTENVMIVDVARNDLSRIAKKGSVHVEKIYDIESYEQVHQMVSTVSCEVKDGTSFQDIIHATFPMASMTGAPKIRAMQLIDQYEYYNRGPFSGCIGYINENGDFDLNILIRSIFYDATKKYVSFSVGSAITAMCDPEKEYEECMLKADALIKALKN